MKKLIVIMFFIFAGLESQARWSCDLACHISEDREVGRISRHASGDDYSDFNAECKEAKGRSTFPGSSDCAYVYCKVFDKRIDTVSGSGDTLTEARQSARSACDPKSESSCGLLNVRTVGAYDCKEN